MLSILLKLELALISWLAAQPALSTIRMHAGHGTDVMDEIPRIIVTATGSGGDLINSGIHQVPVAITMLTSADEPDSLSQLQGAITAALCEDSLPDLLTALNKPATGPDTRAVQGFGISALDISATAEGRDTEKALMGLVLDATVWCHLEST